MNEAEVFIPLTRGKVTVVDWSDYDQKLRGTKWRVTMNGRLGKYYAGRTIGRKTVGMHRVITGCPDGKCVDHINGDPLDNRRQNLRICTPAENSKNQKKRGGTSRFKGVFRDRGRWCAKISLGVFDTEESAALAYDEFMREHHKEFSRFNFPQPGERSAL